MWDFIFSWWTAIPLLCISTSVMAYGSFMSWYYDKYNDHFWRAKKNGTLWKFRSTQHPLYPGW